MIRAIAALAALSAMTGSANAADTLTAPAKQRYVSPGIANITNAAAPHAAPPSPDSHCRELTAGIDAVKHAPDRGQKIVCTVTGNGLKDPDWAVAGAPQPVTVPVDAVAAAEKLGLVH